MHFVNAWNLAELNVPPPNPPVGSAIPQFLNAAVVLGLLKVFRVPVNAPGERVGFGVGLAVPVRGAGSFTPFFTKHARWAVVRFPKRSPRSAVVGSLVIFGLALAVTLAAGFGVALAATLGLVVTLAATLGLVVALVAAFEAGIAPNMATAIDSERRETARNDE